MSKTLEAQRTKSKKVIKTWSRRSTIIRRWWVDLRGPPRKKFIPVFVTENMVGHKMGGLPSSHLPRSLRRSESYQGGGSAPAAPAKKWSEEILFGNRSTVRYPTRCGWPLTSTPSVGM